MQKVISTNIHIPEDLWKAIKIRAAEDGKTMRALILEAVNKLLGVKKKVKKEQSLQKLMLKWSGKIDSPDLPTDGSVNHDHYIYD